MMQTIVLATGNTGKVKEFRTMLSEFQHTVKSLEDYPEIGEIVEDGLSFEENALIKARAVCAATGLIAVADDSGLEVDALDGRPGIYSARYSDEPTAPATPARNNAKLLSALSRIPEQDRTARFCCVIAACAPNGETLVTQAHWEGRIANALSGEQGFGYDPLFFDPELGMTAAMMVPEVKNSRSHRGKALARLLDVWPEFMARAGI